MPAPRPRRSRGLAWWLLAVLLLPPLLLVLSVLALRVLPPPGSAFMLAEYYAAWQRGQQAPALAWRWVPAEAMTADLALAAIAAEDQKFARHGGFDLAAVEAALAERRRGGRVRGASTISQQLAKNLYLWAEQSWLRKGLEAGITLLLEAALPKARILEIYLNIVEFGRGVYGVEAAAQRYFGVSAAHISAEQAALLAAVLPAPKRWSVAAPPPQVRARQRWIRGQMRALGGRRMLAAIAWPGV